MEWNGMADGLFANRANGNLDQLSAWSAEERIINS